MNLKIRILFIIKWYIRNLISACKTLFRLRPEKKLLNIRICDIWMDKEVFDLADEEYEWDLMKKSIEKDGLKDPVEVTRIRNLEQEMNTIQPDYYKAMMEGYIFCILDGNHRAATLKHLAHSNPDARIPVYVVENDAEHVYFRAFYPLHEWDDAYGYENVSYNISLRDFFGL